MDFKNTFMALLRKRHLSYSEFARMLGDGSSPQKVRAWAKGINYPSQEAMKQIAELLGVTIGQLVDASAAGAAEGTTEQVLRAQSYLIRRLDDAAQQAPGVVVRSTVPSLGYAEADYKNKRAIVNVFPFEKKCDDKDERLNYNNLKSQIVDLELLRLADERASVLREYYLLIAPSSPEFEAEVDPSDDCFFTFLSYLHSLSAVFKNGNSNLHIMFTPHIETAEKEIVRLLTEPAAETNKVVIVQKKTA